MLAGLGAPLGGTAYAGGKGGIAGDDPVSKPPPKPKLIGSDAELSFGSGLVERGPDAGDFQIAGERPGAGVAGVALGDQSGAGTDGADTRHDAIETFGRKVGASGGAGVQDPPRPPT